jgi:hypothetical protein
MSDNNDYNLILWELISFDFNISSVNSTDFIQGLQTRAQELRWRDASVLVGKGRSRLQRDYSQACILSVDSELSSRQPQNPLVDHHHVYPVNILFQLLMSSFVSMRSLSAQSCSHCPASITSPPFMCRLGVVGVPLT